MAKAKSKSKAKDKPEEALVHVCRNRRATHDYEITDRVECGIVLVGTEVKSLRLGHTQMEEAYAKVEDGEVWLIGCEIPEYPFGNRLNHAPKRQRKLLLHRREIEKFAGGASEKGFTLVPLRIYFKEGRAKVELGIGRGKQTYDKRQSLKTSEAKRDIDRAMSAKRRR